MKNPHEKEYGTLILFTSLFAVGIFVLTIQNSESIRDIRLKLEAATSRTQVVSPSRGGAGVPVTTNTQTRPSTTNNSNTGTNPNTFQAIPTSSPDLTYTCNGILPCSVGGYCCVSGGPSTGYTVQGGQCGSGGQSGTVGNIGGTCTVGRIMNPALNPSTQTGTTTVTQGSTTTTAVFTKNIPRGSSGTDVKNLQVLLVGLGFLDAKYQTGFYGAMTTNAVRAYQTSRSISALGTVGPMTRAALNQDVSTSGTVDAISGYLYLKPR